MLLKAGIIKSELLYQIDYEDNSLFNELAICHGRLKCLKVISSIRQAQKHGNNLMSEKYMGNNFTETPEIPPLAAE